MSKNRLQFSLIQAMGLIGIACLGIAIVSNRGAMLGIPITIMLWADYFAITWYSVGRSSEVAATSNRSLTVALIVCEMLLLAFLGTNSFGVDYSVETGLDITHAALAVLAFTSLFVGGMVTAVVRNDPILMVSQLVILHFAVVLLNWI